MVHGKYVRELLQWKIECIKENILRLFPFVMAFE